MSIDCWKRWANTGPNSVASSFRTLGWSSSGPKALEGFKPLRSLITPSLETAISFMKGADLSRSGTWVCSFLLNSSVNWPLNSSAFSRSDWATPFPFFIFRGGIPWVSFFWLLMYRQKSLGFALTSPTKLFTYKSCCFLTSALISLLKVSNFDLSLLLPVFFAFAWVSFFLRIFLLISGVIQGCSYQLFNRRMDTSCKPTKTNTRFWWTRFQLANCWKRLKTRKQGLASKKTFSAKEVPPPFFVAWQNEYNLSANQIQGKRMTVSKN